MDYDLENEQFVNKGGRVKDQTDTKWPPRFSPKRSLSEGGGNGESPSVDQEVPPPPPAGLAGLRSVCFGGDKLLLDLCLLDFS